VNENRPPRTKLHYGFVYYLRTCVFSSCLIRASAKRASKTCFVQWSWL